MSFLAHLFYSKKLYIENKKLYFSDSKKHLLMKVLRFLGILILVLVAAFLILGLFAPKDFETERTVVINAPQNQVADYMFRFSNFKDWSPFQKYDPNMKTTLTGEDGQVGSVYSWEGKGNAGSGSMTVDERSNDSMNITVRFLEPWESETKAVWKAISTGNSQTTASWKFLMHSGYPMNGLMMLMGMKNGMNKEFDEGLNKLKANIESGKVSTPSASGTNSFDIKETQFPGGNYAGIRKTVKFTEMDKFFAESFEAIGKSAGARINGKGVGIYYNYDEAKGTSDVAAAFSVSGEEPIAGAKIINIPASPAYMLVYKGGYSGSYAAHEAMGKKLAEAGKKQELCIEEYIVNPGDTKDSNMYVTNIYYLVK